jgi:hypothetical protein
MGKHTTSRESFASATAAFVPKEGPATEKATRQARITGKLHPLVDPKGHNVIRESRPRFSKTKSGLWRLNVGTPLPIRSLLDTTGSMGDNVERALRVLPDLCEFAVEVLPGYDPQYAIGIFGDVVDQFVLCLPQFEMLSERLVEQLTFMVPEGAGGDSDEDPDYGIFASAYLTATYAERIGLKGYEMVISDARGRGRIDAENLVRVFGDEVFELAAKNGHRIDRDDLPTTKEIVSDLLKRAHAFFLQVGANSGVTDFWARLYGRHRVVQLPSVELLPHVQSAIIGLTEGTLELSSLGAFLRAHNVTGSAASTIITSLSKIPIGAQACLPAFKKRPQKGDLFKAKTDLWPVKKADAAGRDDQDEEDTKEEAKADAKEDDKKSSDDRTEWL